MTQRCQESGVITVAQSEVVESRGFTSLSHPQQIGEYRPIHPPTGGASKRAFDLIVSSICLVAAVPLMLVLWALIRLTSKGPGFFVQRRGGLNGTSFWIIKFRTLHVCEDRKVAQVTENDARVTAIGKFLRRSSLDEIPQLINVLKGDMSLIGPRPHALEHDAMFTAIDARYPRRFSARPGITGLAQVNGSRGPTASVESVVRRTTLDTFYIKRWSPVLEMKILLATILILVLGDKKAF